MTSSDTHIGSKVTRPKFKFKFREEKVGTVVKIPFITSFLISDSLLAFLMHLKWMVDVRRQILKPF